MRFEVAVVMGSDSDWSVMQKAVDVLKAFSVSYSVNVISAHRTPDEALEFAAHAHEAGCRVIIAGAGAAAHLAGVLASKTVLPVIAVPIHATSLNGLDALLAMVQMPSGVPVATVAIDGAHNAGLLAVQILATHNERLTAALIKDKQRIRERVQAKNAALQQRVMSSSVL